MKYRHDGYNWLVRLEKGEELLSCLSELVEKENIPTCWISGIGATTGTTIGAYDLNKQDYSWKTFDEHMEILSLQGNISWVDDKPMMHIHGTFSKQADLQAVGGHIKELRVGATCEILLHKWYDGKVTRTHSGHIGLKLLDL